MKGNGTVRRWFSWLYVMLPFNIFKLQLQVDESNFYIIEPVFMIHGFLGKEISGFHSFLFISKYSSINKIKGRIETVSPGIFNLIDIFLQYPLVHVLATRGKSSCICLIFTNLKVVLGGIFGWARVLGMEQQARFCV